MRAFDWLAERLELSRGEQGHNVRPMEGLRGFAVFLVFIVHYATLVDPWVADTPAFAAFNFALLTVGFTGVDLFFVLSGYLIYGSLIGRPQPLGRFLRRRVERIYPAFIAVFVLYVALSFVFPAESKIPSEPGPAALYLAQNFLLLPGLFDIRPMITVAWSLSYEMFYYLAIPLLIAALRLRDRSSAWRTALFLAGAAAFVAWCAVRGGHVHLVMFVAGIVLHEAMGSARVPTPGSVAGSIALAAGLLFTLVPYPGNAGHALRLTVLCVAFFVTCLACFREPRSVLARAFSWTPIRWLGNMSYSYYLLHGLALKGAFLGLALVLPPGIGAGSWVFWALLPPMFAFTLLPTGLLFLAVERPFSLAPSGAAPRVPRPSREMAGAAARVE